MKLEEIRGKSKKSGKEYVGYVIKIGEYQTPIFFPSKVELMYIKQVIAKLARENFQEDLDFENLGE